MAQQRLTTGLALDRIVDPAVIARFMRHVKRSKATGSCWIWTGCIRCDNATNTPTYGQFRPGGRESRPVHAHRISYVIFIDDIEAGMDVHHECGRTTCVNWQHLALLSRSDNAREVNGRKSRTKAARRAALDAVPF